MFTPEFASAEKGEFVLVANHALGSPEQVASSVAYNAARIAFGRRNVPAELQRCRVVYDIRGQNVSDSVLASIRQQLSAASVEFRH
jgi:hypothetical protein